MITARFGSIYIDFEDATQEEVDAMVKEFEERRE